MSAPSLLAQELKNRLLRCTHAVFGLVIYALGSFLQIQANIGLSPWNSLTQGLSLRTGMTFGTASILISVIIILLDLTLRAPIGLGTILNALIIGWGIDFFLWTGWLPPLTELPSQLLSMMVGLVVMCVGMKLYMAPGLSCGPRDSLLVALGKRFPNISIGKVNIALLAVVLVGGVMMGSTLGLGTVIATFGTGPVMDAVFRVMHFEPRSVTHENLAQTVRALSAARKTDRALR